MPTFELAEKAQYDVEELIIDGISDNEFDAIMSQLQYLADTPFLKGRLVEDMLIIYRKTNILKGKYLVYFSRTDYGIIVWRIRNARRLLITPYEIMADSNGE